MAQGRLYQWLRLGFALLTIAAIVVQLVIGIDQHDTKVFNFFSFFTIQSNLLAAAVLIIGVVVAFKGRGSSPAWELLHGAAVAYMTTTFFVYAALLSGLPDDLDLTEPWVNVVLHQLMPIVVVLDWLIAPPFHRLKVRQALVWMIFPAAYCVYSLIRGSIVDWYPYPFLNPDEAGGYPGVTAYSIGIAVLFVAIGEKAREWWMARGARTGLAT